MLSRRKQTKLEITTRAGIKKEMAQPRMAMSVRIAELNLATTRISESTKASALSGKKAGKRVAVRRKSRASSRGV
jgi:hypothetical protein